MPHDRRAVLVGYRRKQARELKLEALAILLLVLGPPLARALAGKRSLGRRGRDLMPRLLDRLARRGDPYLLFAPAVLPHDPQRPPREERPRERRLAPRDEDVPRVACDLSARDLHRSTIMSPGTDIRRLTPLSAVA